MINKGMKPMKDLENYVNEFRRLASGQAWILDFPRGVCSDASEVLGALLLKHGYGEWELIRRQNEGIRGVIPNTHTWIRQDQMVIDVTYDQFTEMDRCFDPNAALILDSENSLNERFPVSLGEPRPINLDSIGSGLSPIYNAIELKLAYLSAKKWRDSHHLSEIVKKI